eukprot:CAMPEP_0182463134 /NCGR_PEP_ID=MMETSP1319-20130603/7161_1 /TAXON_ID=172717 /ORGANISM="Bolidomonas pacifica, Strain RCC208" /LENGTH=209 /DNA_ID=CAMNT_0024662641 /DNA_START=134 /DNA_END=760 /DNA_ORIENTATION=+
MASAAPTSIAIITGASRGFGASLCRAVRSLHPTCKIYCLSRPSPSLTAVAASVSGTAVPIDFSTPQETYSTAFKDLLSTLPPDLPATLYNNHGTLGPLLSLPPPSSVPPCVDLNVTSCLTLSLSFASAYPSGSIVNVSSLAAVQPFPTWSLYCAGKAARDMFHACLSKTHAGYVLNYAPGAMDTDMQGEIREGESDEENRKAFVRMKEE